MSAVGQAEGYGVAPVGKAPGTLGAPRAVAGSEDPSLGPGPSMTSTAGGRSIEDSPRTSRRRTATNPT